MAQENKQGGISNRDRETEIREQQELPERGRSKSESGGTDAGRTSGGGSLGHDQPEDVADTTPIRNNPRRDPVMPADDSALNTKI